MQWYQLDHMQTICRLTSLQTDNYINTSSLKKFFTGWMLFLALNQQCQSTEGTLYVVYVTYCIAIGGPSYDGNMYRKFCGVCTCSVWDMPANGLTDIIYTDRQAYRHADYNTLHPSWERRKIIPTLKGKGSPYSITERRIPELIPVLCCQPAGDASHKSSSRLPLLSARPAVTSATLKRTATNFAAWSTEAQWVSTVCVRLLPDSVTTVIWTRALLRLSLAR